MINNTETTQEADESITVKLSTLDKIISEVVDARSACASAIHSVEYIERPLREPPLEPVIIERLNETKEQGLTAFHACGKAMQRLLHLSARPGKATRPAFRPDFAGRDDV